MSKIERVTAVNVMDEQLKIRMMENTAKVALLLRDVLMAAALVGCDVGPELAEFSAGVGRSLTAKYAELVGDDRALETFALAGVGSGDN